MTDTRWGATPDEWFTFETLAGLGPDLLPVVSDPHATISKSSKLSALGKTPSRFNRHGEVVGIADWTERQSTPNEIARWSDDPRLGICLQTRTARAIDIDIEDAEQAAEVRRMLEPFKLPMRTRADSPKFLALLTLPGDYTKRRFKTAHGMVEFLATGQQAVVAGTHPKGARYEWPGGLPATIPAIDPERFEALWQDLVDRFAIEEPTESTASVKREKLTNAKSNDPVAQYLIDNEWVKSEGRDGQLFITCPFEDGHSTETGDSSTAYFPAHTGGYERGHFKCLHASCQGRSDESFRAAIGYRDNTFAEFDDLTAEPAGQAPAEGGEVCEFRLQTVAEFCKSRAPAGWFVKGVLPRAELGVLFGESGSGKSFMALDIAAQIAQGLPWRGRKTAGGRVVFVAAEGAGGFRRRLDAYCEANQVAREALDIRIIDAAPNLTDKAAAVSLAKSIKQQGGADLLFVDTLAQTMPGGNENSSEDMGRVIAHCKGLQRALGCMVVLIHHAGKDSTKGARGWSGLRAAADVELEVVRGNPLRALYVTKQKDGEDGLVFGFRLKPVLLGTDEDGDAITSCVVDHTDEDPRETKGEKLGGVQAIVMQAYQDLAGTAGRVEEGALLKRAAERMPAPTGKRDTRRQHAKQALEPLIVKGVFERSEGDVVLL